MKRTTTGLSGARLVILRTVTIGLTVLMVGRLFDLAILRHASALVSAKNQYGVKQTLQAERGVIGLRDLNGGKDYPVAMNVTSYQVIADPFLINDPAKMAASLAPALELSIDELLPKISDKKKRYVILKKRLEKEDANKIEALNLRGITLDPVKSRLYPELSLAAHTIGFIDASGEGRYGIEGYFNEDLKGYDGALVGEKDAKRRIISEGKTAKPRNGTDITLTIDRSLQFVVENTLRDALKKYEADSGSIVIIDVKTGAVLALANDPNYDLNKYNEVPAQEQHRFINQAVSGTWEPGSIFKTFTLAAGMDMGLFEPDTKVELPCSIKVDGFEIRNAEDKCYPNPDVVQILADSVNVGTIWAADKLGNDNFAKYISDFGFGAKTGVELQPEATGRITDSKKWRDVTRATVSFGQGMTTSPLQMAAAYAAIANGGKLMHPYLVAKRVDSNGKVIETKPREVRQVLKPETAAKMTMLLEKVVTDGHGKRAAVPGYRIGGKTGTAQVVGEDGKYEEDAHIGAFAGYFPLNEPRFAMVVKLDRPKAVEFAESSAAPTFSEIAKWLLHYAKIPPTEPIQ